MASLQIGQEDLLLRSEVDLQVVSLELQVLGHFFKYDPFFDKNLLIKEALFLQVMQVELPQKDGPSQVRYMLHVVDQTGKLSYCRTVVSSNKPIQFIK